MLKKLRRKLARLGPGILFQLSRTWRIRFTGEVPKGAAVYAFWHGDMLPVWKHFANSGSLALVSLSRDGDLFTSLVHRWGFDTIRGSSSKGGSAAFNEMVTALKEGKRVFITPDGPRGPRYGMKPGAVIAAYRANVPLVLCRVNAHHAIQGTNWDQFLVPLPFSRIDLEFVTIDLPPDTDRSKLASLNTYAENLLKKLTPLL